MPERIQRKQDKIQLKNNKIKKLEQGQQKREKGHKKRERQGKLFWNGSFFKNLYGFGFISDSSSNFGHKDRNSYSTVGV